MTLSMKNFRGKSEVTFFIAISLFAAAVIAIVLCVASYVLISPTFYVIAQRNSDGSLEIVISPNYRVNSIYNVSVKDSDTQEIIAANEKPTTGEQFFILAEEHIAGSTITVTCDLQYDLWAPAITQVQQSVVLP